MWKSLGYLTAGANAFLCLAAGDQCVEVKTSIEGEKYSAIVIFLMLDIDLRYSMSAIDVTYYNLRSVIFVCNRTVIVDPMGSVHLLASDMTKDEI